MVAVLGYGCGEIERGPGGVGKGLVPNYDGAAGEQWGQGFGEPAGEIEARLAIARADIGVDKDGRRSETARGKGDCLSELAKKHVVVVGDAVWMGGDPAVETVDVPFRKETAQVVVRTAVAEPDFKDVTGPSVDKGGGLVETQTLGLEAADCAVEPAHSSRCRSGWPWRRAASSSSSPPGVRVRA